MKSCKCEHWEVCPVCKPEWFDSEGNRLPPEPTPLQKANGRIEELEQQLAERDEQISDLTVSSDTYFAERNSARDVWRRASKDRDELRQQLAERETQVTLLRDGLAMAVSIIGHPDDDGTKHLQKILAATAPKEQGK